MKKLRTLLMGLGLAATLGLASSDVDASGKTEDTLSQRTFATLGVCNAAASGSTATITDGPTSPTWNMVATGGGITISAVYCDGTSWKVYAGAGSSGGGGGGTVQHMAPPSGAGAFYTSTNMIAQEIWSTSTLNTANWNNNFGQSWFGRASNHGLLAAPYSGGNCTNNICDQSISYQDPYPYGFGTQLVAGQTPLQRISDSTGAICGTELNCLAFSSSLDNHFSNLGYSWNGASITSYTTGPATGTGTARVSPFRLAGCNINGASECYMQIRAKMPDCRYGNWTNFYFMDDAAAGGAAASNELDLHECGLNVTTGDPTTNFRFNSNDRIGGNRAQSLNVGVDMSQGYHIYGARYVPNTGTQIGLFAVYFDNVLYHAWSPLQSNGTSGCVLWDAETASKCTTGTIANVDYELIIDQEVAQPNQAAVTPGCSFHTCPDGVHNGPFTLYVNEIQVYRK